MPKPRTVGELFHESLHFESKLLANALFVGVQKGLIKPNDEADAVLNSNVLEAFTAEIYECINNNTLGMETVQLYSAKVAPGTFAFYLGKDEQSVINLHKKMYKTSPKIHDITDQIDMPMYFEKRKEVLTFWEVREQTKEFPCFVGEMEKGA